MCLIGTNSENGRFEDSKKVVYARSRICQKSCMKVNVQKTKVVIFNAVGKIVKSPAFTVGG